MVVVSGRHRRRSAVDAVMSLMLGNHLGLVISYDIVKGRNMIIPAPLAAKPGGPPLANPPPAPPPGIEGNPAGPIDIPPLAP